MEKNSGASRKGHFISFSFNNRQGPSLPANVTNSKGELKYPIDFVCAVLCHCPSLLHKWRYRRRPQNWPTPDVLDKVASLPVFAVPVPERESVYTFVQWRFCFNFGELILTHSLNHTQMKVYILLKIIAKYLLKPICDHMTSFIMKNVSFWLAEMKPVEEFTPDLLIHRLMDVLTILRESIQAKQLKYYMIPERNLFTGKITDIQQFVLLDTLAQFIANDGQDALKLYIPELSTNAAKQSLKPLAVLYDEMYMGNLRARVETINTMHYTVDQLAHQYEKTATNEFLHDSALHYLPHAVSNLFHTVSKCGLKMLYNPLGVKHEAVFDPTLDVDDYSRWVCEKCQRVALSVPMATKGPERQLPPNTYYLCDDMTM